MAITDKADSPPQGGVGATSWPRRSFFASAFLLVATLLIYVPYGTDVFGTLTGAVPDALCEAMTGNNGWCSAASGLATRQFFVLAVLLTIAILPAAQQRFAELLTRIEARRASSLWLWASGAGVALVVLPYPLMAFGRVTPEAVGALPILVGLPVMFIGVLGWLTRPGDVVETLGWPLLGLVAAGIFFPDLSSRLSSAMWGESWLQQATIQTSLAMVTVLTEATVMADFATSEVAVDGFEVVVGHPCAGLSGIAFSSLAVGTYVFIARRDLRVGRALLALPLVALVSWLLNSLRVAILLILGARISPQLAVDGFHTYGGWIAFTMLSAAAILTISRVPWFQAASGAGQNVPRPRQPLPPLFQDPVSAQILPFAVFLFTALLAGGLFVTPAAGYPVRVLATAAVLLAFHRCLPRPIGLDVRWSALGAGVGIAGVWMAVQAGGPAVRLADVVPGLGGAMLAGWVVFRLAGTALLVPVIEELFFRGYLMQRLTALPVPHARVGALIATSLLFAVLHDAWVLAFAAGLVFGWLVLRPGGRLTDAVVAHAAANALIGLYALIANDWSVI